MKVKDQVQDQQADPKAKKESKQLKIDSFLKKKEPEEEQLEELEESKSENEENQKTKGKTKGKGKSKENQKQKKNKKKSQQEEGKEKKGRSIRNRRKIKKEGPKKPKKPGRFPDAKYPYKSVIAQLAKLGKGKQAVCKKCKVQIDLGALRVGVQSTHWNMVQWCHLNCFPITRKFRDYDIYDMELLEEDDRQLVRDHFEGKSEAAKAQFAIIEKKIDNRLKRRENWKRKRVRDDNDNWNPSSEKPQEDTLENLCQRRLTRHVIQKIKYLEKKLKADNDGDNSTDFDQESTQVHSRRPVYNEDEYFQFSEFDFSSDCLTGNDEQEEQDDGDHQQLQQDQGIYLSDQEQNNNQEKPQQQQQVKKVRKTNYDTEDEDGEQNAQKKHQQKNVQDLQQEIGSDDNISLF